MARKGPDWQAGWRVQRRALAQPAGDGECCQDFGEYRAALRRERSAAARIWQGCAWDARQSMIH